MVLNTLMRNTTKHHVATKANTFTKLHLQALLKYGGLLDDNLHDYLESKICGFLGIYGLLRCAEILNISKGSIKNSLLYGMGSNPIVVEYKFSTKTRTRGFTFHIPARFRPIFLQYYKQLPTELQDNKRFLWNLTTAPSSEFNPWE